MIDSKREDELRRDVEMLYFGYRAFTSLADSILADYGLGRSHHRILYFVQRDPGISVGDLVLVLKVTKQAIHRPLKELEERGLLTVTPDPQDRRFRRVTTTASGAELEERLTGAQTRLLEEVFAEFDEATAVRWRHVMMRLAETDE